MENWQLQRLRDGLAAYRSLGDNSRQLTWTDVESDIELMTSINVPEKRLSKFVIGEPHRDKGLKALGVRNYPALYDYRLKAVISFLTNEDSKGFMFSLDDLKIYPTDLGILRLTEYLNDDRSGEHFIKPPAFRGLFITQQQDLGITSEWLLRFSQSSHRGFIPCALVTVPQESQLMPESTIEELETISGALRYRGWAILTQQENLLLLMQKERNGENLMFISMGIDINNHQKHNDKLNEKINTLMLLMHDQPNDDLIINKDSDQTILRERIIQTWQKNLLIFTRMDKNPLQISNQGNKK